MSELLDLANDILEARRRGFMMNPPVEFENACTVIEGYQELLRRIVDVYENCPPGYTWGQLVPHIRYAKACIPEVDDDHKA